MTWQLATSGRSAAEYVLRKVYRVGIEKALNPLDRADYDKICRHIATSLAGQAVPVEAAALKRALESLDVDWKSMPAEARSKVLSVAGSYLGAPVANRVVPKIEQTLSVEAKQLVQGTKEGAIDRYDLRISGDFNSTDERIAKFVSGSQGHFVRDRYGERSENFSAKAKDIVSAGLESGLGSTDIAESLHRELGESAAKGSHYWTMIAMVFANRSRTLTQVASYSEAGIEQYSWESILDEATTMQCRFLHGRTFPVQNAIGKFEEVESSRSPASIKRIQPFVQMSAGRLYYGSGESRTPVADITQNVIGQRDKIGSFANAMSTADLMKAGIHAPPLHGHCRSNIVPTLGSATPARTQVQVPAGPTEPEVTPEQQQALEAINSSADEGMVYMSDHFENSAEPQKPYSYAEMDGEWVSKKMRLEDLVPTQNTVKADRVRKLVENPKILERSEILVVKKGDRFYIDAGNEAALAHKLLGKRGVSVKVMDLDKPEGPPALLHAKAKEFSDALALKDGGKRARELLREQIQEAFPGAIPRVTTGGGQELLSRPVKSDSALTHANGYYAKSNTPENGQIVIREERVEYSKQAMKILEKGGINRRLEQGDDGILALDGLRTLLHEEIHGHSRFTARSYHKLGAALEEVGTELSAQKVIDRLVPKAQIFGRTDELGMGSYQDQVRAVTQAVQSVTGKSYRESQELIVDAHHKGILAKTGEFSSEYHALQDFVGALAVPEEQQQAIRGKLFEAF